MWWKSSPRWGRYPPKKPIDSDNQAARVAPESDSCVYMVVYSSNWDIAIWSRQAWPVL